MLSSTGESWEVPPLLQTSTSIDESSSNEEDKSNQVQTSSKSKVPITSSKAWVHFRRTKNNKRATCKNDGTKGVPSYVLFDQDASRKALVRMIIMDELPFRFVEKEGFRYFMSVVQPRFVVPSRRTITRGCMDLFVEEKKKLRQFFKKHKGCVSLTTDIWTSVQNINYMCLTVHFIDSDWNLHKKIINFCPISNQAGETIGKMVEKCLIHWGINKVFTVTVDNASSNDLGIKYLKRKFTSWGTIILDGEFLHMRCGAHILGLVVKDGLQEMHESILRIRAAVRYVRSSIGRAKKFKECLEHQKLSTKVGLCLDVETMWNSTYLMLESALKLKQGFDMLEIEDEKYVDDLTKTGLGPPRLVDWTYARSLLPILKCFYDSTLKISGSRYVTGNEYMQEIFGVGWKIQQMIVSCDEECKRSMAEKMKKKFDKYWHSDNVNMIIYVAHVLDPRYKLKYVSWMIRESYNDDDKANEVIEKLNGVLQRLFKHYESLYSRNIEPSSTRVEKNVEIGVDGMNISRDYMNYMFEKYEKDGGEESLNNELESYLSDVREKGTDENFNVLWWWKATGAKYPILSQMVKDILAIPVSTVASESAFNTGGRVVDSFRSSLTPQLVEALVCTQDWFRSDYEPSTFEDILDDLEKFEEDFLPSKMKGASTSVDGGYLSE